MAKKAINTEITDSKSIENQNDEHVSLENEIQPELYTIEKADLKQHPELKESGLNEGDKIEYESQKVLKYATADQETVVWENWPRYTGSNKL